MTGISDQRLEAALREMLEERRPGNAAPELRDRIARIPLDVRPRGRFGGLRPVLSLGAAVAGLAVVAAVATLVFGGLSVRPPVTNVGASQTAIEPAATFDPAIEGPGIILVQEGDAVGQPIAWLTLIPWTVAVIAGVALAVFALKRSGLRRIGAVVGIVLLAGAAQNLATHPGFEFGNSWGPATGLGPIGPGSGLDDWYVTADPGESFTFAFDVRNPGPLPIRIMGVVEHVHDEMAAVPRWTAVWFRRSVADDDFPGPEDALPFESVEVPPEGRLVLFIVGRASRCAAGSAFSVEESGAFAYVARPTVSIAYSVVGLSSVGEVDLPVPVAEPRLENRCG